MAVTKKIIGRIPICFGTWYAKQGGWGIKNRVTLYGSEFESLHENNTVPPAVYDEIENTVSFNENDWRVISNGTEAWLADAKIDALGTWEESPEFVEVCLDKNGRIIYGAQKDGNFIFGAGVPEQIKEYFKEHGGDLIHDIEAFLAGFDGDETLKEYLDENYGTYEENPEFVEVKLDANGYVLWGIRKDGDIVFGCGIPSEIQKALNKITKDIDDNFGDIRGTFHYISNPEYLFACLDAEDRVLYGVTVEGKFRAADLDFDIDIPEEEAKWLNTIFSLIEDPERRIDITLDANNKLLSWRDGEGVKHETNLAVEHSLELSSKAMTAFQQALKDSGFTPGGGGDWSDKEVVEIPFTQSYAILNLEIDGIPKYDNEVKSGYAEYYDGFGNSFKKEIKIETQGQSSKNFARIGKRGNYTLDINDGSEIKFGSWIPQDSFHLKGTPKDITHGILATSYKWAYIFMEYLDAKPNRVLLKNSSEITTTNASGDRFTDWIDDARCLPDGFPVEIYVNGDYWGLYAWQLKKHRDNYSMDKKDYTSLFIDADDMMTANYQHGIWNDGPDAINPDDGTAKWWEGFDIKGPKDLICMDGSKFDGDHPKELMDSTSPYWDSADKKKREGSAQAKAIIRGFSTKYLEVKELIDNNNIEGAKAKFNENFDYNACMLVYIFNCLMNNGDSVKKNTLWGTWKDGKIAPMLWDIDGVYGTDWWGGICVAPSVNLWRGIYATAAWPLALFWTLYESEIKAKYIELRQAKIIDISTWRNIMFGWVNNIGTEAFERDAERWPDMPCNRQSYDNTEYWKRLTVVRDGTTAPFWNTNTTYNVGDKVDVGLSTPTTGLMLRYQAIKASDANNPQPPVTDYYDSFPIAGGYYDSPKRMEKWMDEEITLCDAVCDYFDELDISFTAYRNSDSEYTLQCSNMIVRSTNDLANNTLYIDAHVTKLSETTGTVTGVTVLTEPDTDVSYTTVKDALDSITELNVPSEDVKYIQIRVKDIVYTKKL